MELSAPGRRSVERRTEDAHGGRRRGEAVVHRRADRGDAGAERPPWRQIAAIRSVVRSRLPRQSWSRRPHCRARPRLERGRVHARSLRDRRLTLFTLRMGDWRDLDMGPGRLYAEKAIMCEDGQRAPHHYHVVKTEDIVNRGGARFVVELFKVDRNGEPVKERFRALKDVSVLDLAPGDRVRLEPGESLTLEPYVAHAFWAEGGAAIAGEVSLANDDRSDNYFLPPLDPPPPIEEDSPARYLTVTDYERL